MHLNHINKPTCLLASFCSFQQPPEAQKSLFMTSSVGQSPPHSREVPNCSWASLGCPVPAFSQVSSPSPWFAPKGCRRNGDKGTNSCGGSDDEAINPGSIVSQLDQHRAGAAPGAAAKTKWYFIYKTAPPKTPAVQKTFRKGAVLNHKTWAFLPFLPKNTPRIHISLCASGEIFAVLPSPPFLLQLQRSMV